MDTEPTYVAHGRNAEYRKCKTHGFQKLIPIYEFETDKTTNLISQKLYWGCWDCFSDKYGEPHEVEIETCLACNETNNLVDCPLCAKPVCKKHSIEEVCCDCYQDSKVGLGD